MTDPETEARYRRVAAAKIERILELHPGKPDVDTWLAIGEVYDGGSRWQREVWLEEMRRLTGNRGTDE